jgi:transcriptional regulator with XRE-family HTH domain
MRLGTCPVKLQAVNEADTFRAWLQAEKRRRQMSQRMLGQLSGISHSTISRILSDSSRTPSLPTATRLAAALGAQLPPFAVQVQLTPSTEGRIRAALVEQGIESDAIDEMLATYRRRLLQDLSAG